MINRRTACFSGRTRNIFSILTLHLLSIAILAGFSIVFAADIAAGDSKGFRFDFTSAEVSPAPGWTAVGSKTLFSSEKGYGWTNRWGNAYLHNAAKVNGPLLKGFIQADNPTAKEGVFKIAVPNGIYEVEVVVGSAIKTEGRKNICVSLNGKVLISPPGVGGYGAVVKRRLPAVVENGILKIRFFISGKGRLGLYAVSAVEVKDAARAKLLKERWIDAESTKELKRKKKIEINGKEYT
ncbi:MAG: hypothetical protein KAG97_04145, partial [Victivallales bacterium]|nr:hypothetical protein [Victivallales bacterium]